MCCSKLCIFRQRPNTFPCCSMLQYAAACCSVLQRVANQRPNDTFLCCIMLQRVTVRCSVLQCDAVCQRPNTLLCCSLFQYVAECCNVAALEYRSVFCESACQPQRVFLWGVLHSGCNTHCNTHCNTLSVYCSSQRKGSHAHVTHTHTHTHLRIACERGHLCGSACQPQWVCLWGVLQSVAICCSVLQCFAIRCSMLQCVAICCSVLQCVTICCSVLHRIARLNVFLWAGFHLICVLQCVLLCCSVLQYADCDSFHVWPDLLMRDTPYVSAVLGSVLNDTPQHTATHCNTLQRAATHCNALQHTATHCNTLQHTATRCNTLPHTALHEIQHLWRT